MSDKPEKSKARRTLTLVSEVGGVIGVIVLAVTAAFSKGVRDWLETAANDAGAWLYPDPLIVLLGLAVLGLLAWRFFPRRRAVPLTSAQRTRDRKLLEVLVQTTPRSDVKWLSQHDFGGRWRDDKMLPFQYMVEERDEVEHQFYEPGMEKRRKKLIKAINELLDVQAQRAGVDPGGHMSISAWDETPHPGGEDARRKRKEESRKLINDKADKVVKAYDDLLERGRELGILERTSWTDQ